MVSTPIGQPPSSQCPLNEEERLKMHNIPYASAVGNIIYSMVCCRPDIEYGMSIVSKFMANPGKWSLGGSKMDTKVYLKGSTDIGLKFARQGREEEAIIGYVNYEFAGYIDRRKSLTGFVFTMFGTAINWKANF